MNVLCLYSFITSLNLSIHQAVSEESILPLLNECYENVAHGKTEALAVPEDSPQEILEYSSE